jgi:RNA polymerase sigma factor (sigma-70 family)
MDAALLESFRRGDRVALERVYHSHIDAVERFLASRLGRARRFSATNLADLVQEVFLRAFSPSARNSYDGERDYGPFLITIAKNAFIDWIRRSAREVGDTRALEALVDVAADDPAADELFEPELVAATASYIEQLSPELRRVHEHRFVQAEPQRSAADALGISRQNLRTLEKKLVDGLRRELKPITLVKKALGFVNPTGARDRRSHG